MKTTRITHCAESDLETPAFVVDEAEIALSCRQLRAIADSSDCKLLFSLKSLVVERILRLIARNVDGFSASSLYEARLARETLGQSGFLHIITPGLRPLELFEVAGLSTHLVFNSVAQWCRLQASVLGSVECGIRINPQISLVKDVRYDPCRRHSKLGVSPTHLLTAIREGQIVGDHLDGIHFHTNCDASDFSGLLRTVTEMDRKLRTVLDRLRWVNIGGGYDLANATRTRDFFRAVKLLRSHRRLDVFFEPGAAFVRNAGILVSTVLDILPSGRKHIAVLDTTVNHVPEVFEYQFEPDLVGDTPNGQFVYTLAGCSCLAGDVFGEYAFTEPLRVGSRVVFKNVGAYSIVKANMFNGINLPSIYALDEGGSLELIKQFTFDDFAGRFGFRAHEYANH